MRLFIAFDLPQEIVNYVVKAQKELKESDLIKGTFPKAEHMHVTLLFLGEVSDAEVDDVIKKLSEVNVTSFNIELDGVEVDNEICPKRVWIALKSEKLNAVIQNLSKLFPKSHDKRPIRPHVTLARIKVYKDKAWLKKPLHQVPDGISFHVDAIRLKQSELSSSGPTYTDIFVKPLDDSDYTDPAIEVGV